MKFFFDQTAASIVNLVLFVIIINLLKGESLAKSWDLVILVSGSSANVDYTDADFCRIFDLL